MARPAKKPLGLQPYEPVVVTWEDAFCDSSAQHDSVGLALLSYKPCIRKSIGLYVGKAERDGRQAIMIATDDDRTEDTPSAIGGISHIPIGMVISCVPVRRRRP